MAAENTKQGRNDEQGNALTRPFIGIYTYLSEVRAEMRKVTWPERDDVVRLTTIVLAATLASALVLGALSYIFSLVIIEIGLNGNQEWIFGVMFAVFFGAAFYITNRGGGGRNY